MPKGAIAPHLIYFGVVNPLDANDNFTGLEGFQQPTIDGFKAGVFFNLVNDRAGADIQRPCGVAYAAAIQGHLYDLQLNLGQAPVITMVEYECLGRASRIQATIPLLAVPVLPRLTILSESHRGQQTEIKAISDIPKNKVNIDRQFSPKKQAKSKSKTPPSSPTGTG